MNIYNVWIDASGKNHSIVEMETSYINNCVNEIRKAADAWRIDTVSNLSQAEKEDVHIPLHRAWFVVHALDYLYSFKRELEDRWEDTSNVEKLIKRIIDARNERC